MAAHLENLVRMRFKDHFWKMSNNRHFLTKWANSIYMHFNVIFAILKFCLKDQKLTAACSGKGKCISLDIFVGEDICAHEEVGVI